MEHLKVTPVGHNLLVKPVPVKETTSSGILLPESQIQQIPKGTIINSFNSNKNNFLFINITINKKNIRNLNISLKYEGPLVAPIQKNTKVAELKAAEPMTLLRDERNYRLAQSDWTQLSDTPIVSSSKIEKDWKDYRQQLRDITVSSNPKLTADGDLDMTSVNWPTPPS